MDEQGKRTLIYGYECEIDTFLDVCKGMKGLNYSDLNNEKKYALIRKLEDVKKYIGIITKRIN